jgi:hypothetical protein
MSALHAADEDYVRKLARCRVPPGEIAFLMQIDEAAIARIIATSASVEPPEFSTNPTQRADRPPDKSPG